jgi:Flp pilus assembly protein TadG
MRILRKLCKHEQGAAAVEFAFAMPLFISLFFLIAQCGLLFLAEAGIRHSTDRAARAVNVYLPVKDPVSGKDINDTSTIDEKIWDTVKNTAYGIGAIGTTPAEGFKIEKNKDKKFNCNDLAATSGPDTFYTMTSGSTKVSVCRGTSNGENYADITMSYDAPINLIVFRTPTITLSETRRAYLP